LGSHWSIFGGKGGVKMSPRPLTYVESSDKNWGLTPNPRTRFDAIQNLNFIGKRQEGLL